MISMCLNKCYPGILHFIAKKILLFGFLPILKGYVDMPYMKNISICCNNYFGIIFSTYLSIWIQYDNRLSFHQQYHQLNYWRIRIINGQWIYIILMYLNAVPSDWISHYSTNFSFSDLILLQLIYIKFLILIYIFYLNHY